mmetsp:Transcript_65852/g.99290  ORF Transcript_65852/g.99290 Transcript_65852/m.99290 type:complete len:159 (+) Transcript_65852:742-1218(+)
MNLLRDWTMRERFLSACLSCQASNSMPIRSANAREYFPESTPTAAQPPTPSSTAVSVDPSGPMHTMFASSPPFSNLSGCGIEQVPARANTVGSMREFMFGMADELLLGTRAGDEGLLEAELRLLRSNDILRAHLPMMPKGPSRPLGDPRSGSVAVKIF